MAFKDFISLFCGNYFKILEIIIKNKQIQFFLKKPKIKYKIKIQLSTMRKDLKNNNNKNNKKTYQIKI